MIILPENTSARWQQCLSGNNPLCWRALSMWMQAETTMAQLDNNLAMAADTQLLSDVAHGHYMALMPKELEAA